MVCSFTEGKDIQEIFRFLLKEAAEINIFKGSHPKLINYEGLVSIAQQEEAALGMKGKIGPLHTEKGSKEQLREIFESSKEDEVLLICGSFYYMREI